MQRELMAIKEGMTAIKEELAKFQSSLAVVDVMLDEATSEDEPNQSTMQLSTVQPSNDVTYEETDNTIDEDGLDVADEVNDELDYEDDENFDDMAVLYHTCMHNAWLADDNPFLFVVITIGNKEDRLDNKIFHTLDRHEYKVYNLNTNGTNNNYIVATFGIVLPTTPSSRSDIKNSTSTNSWENSFPLGENDARASMRSKKNLDDHG